MGISKLQAVSDEDFESKVLKVGLPCLVFASADWAQPAKAMVPILEQLEAEYRGRVLFFELNDVDAPSRMQMYGVMGIPAFLILKGGKVVEYKNGAMDSSQVKALLDQHC